MAVVLRMYSNDHGSQKFRELHRYGCNQFVDQPPAQLDIWPKYLCSCIRVDHQKHLAVQTNHMDGYARASPFIRKNGLGGPTEEGGLELIAGSSS